MCYVACTCRLAFHAHIAAALFPIALLKGAQDTNILPHCSPYSQTFAGTSRMPQMVLWIQKDVLR